MKAVEDMQCLGTFLADHVQVGLPHVRADKLDLRSQLLSDGGEETLEGFDGAFLADPEQPGLVSTMSLFIKDLLRTDSLKYQTAAVPSRILVNSCFFHYL
jgi:hypothetical protein